MPGWLCLLVFLFIGEARLSPDYTVKVYRKKATGQVYSSSSTTGPSKLHGPQVLTITTADSTLLRLESTLVITI